MGLDMWLYAKRFIWSSEREKDDLKELITSYILKGSEAGKIIEDMKDYELKELTFEVGNWRKANQIHNWFVENVQEGNDDCGEYSVTKEKLTELLDIVKRILNKKNKKKQVELAKELLPTQSGFFFGGTDYDNWYLDDLKKTKEIIEKLLKIKNFEDYNICYSSSW